MKEATRFSPYRRARFLATVAAGDRPLAARLCAMLEAAFDAKDISIYSGFPIVVRDMEWIAGFAMRKSGPVAYCCSPATLAAMGAELQPYMSGKSCIAVKPRRGESIDVVLALIGHAFRAASEHGGMISKTDLRVRERARAKSATAKAPSKRTGPGARVKSTAKTLSKSPSKSPPKSPTKSPSKTRTRRGD